MTLPIALQLYTVRDVMAKNFADTLKAVADIGYKNVEFAGLYDHDPAQVRKMCDDLGLTVCSSHVAIERFTGDGAFDQLERELKTLGTTLAVCPGIFRKDRSVAAWTTAVEELKNAEAQCRQAGLSLSYHNHAFEFDAIADHPEKACPFDLIFDGIPQMSSELDIAWVTVGGQDVLATMQRLSGRVPLLHVKDAHKELNSDGGPTFTEISTGNVPIKAALDIAESVGVKYLIVEQDSDWVDGDPMASVKTSFENLTKLLGA